MSNEIEIRRRRAAYRAAHRGTKEMDLVLGAFAQARLPEMTEAELALFEDFLLLPDPDLQDVIWGAGVPAQKFAGLVCEIRVSHGLDATP